MTPPSPWSVPWLPFSSTRRANSENWSMRGVAEQPLVRHVDVERVDRVVHRRHQVGVGAGTCSCPGSRACRSRRSAPRTPWCRCRGRSRRPRRAAPDPGRCSDRSPSARTAPPWPRDRASPARCCTVPLTNAEVRAIDRHVRRDARRASGARTAASLPEFGLRERVLLRTRESTARSPFAPSACAAARAPCSSRSADRPAPAAYRDSVPASPGSAARSGSPTTRCRCPGSASDSGWDSRCAGRSRSRPWL